MNFLEFKNRFITSFILFLIVFLIIKSNFFLIYAVIIFSVLSLIEFFNLTKKAIKTNFLKILSNSIFVIYLSLFSIIFSYFAIYIQTKIILFILLFGCVGSDIGGYIFGKMFKGPKLTKISPKKTISGSIGSFFFTFLIIGSLMFFLTNKIDLEILFLSIATSFACQIGDLFFSFLKRKAKIKDTGNFLPGHGGILDRLDGILLGIPFGYLTLIFMKV
jgi:phosphatidate cytidylyltransferase